MFAKEKPLVGLDLGTNTIKVVELSKSSKGVYLQTAGMATIPPGAITTDGVKSPELVLHVIQKLFEENKIKNKNVAIAASGTAVSIKRLFYPKFSVDELAEIISWEAEQYLPSTIKDPIIDFQVIPGATATDKLEVLLVAVEKERVQQLVDLATQAGLKTAVVDVTTFALENQYRLNYEPETGKNIAIVDIGANTTNVSMLRNGYTIFSHAVSIGGAHYNRAIKKEFNLPEEEIEIIKQGKNVKGIGIQQIQPIIVDLSYKIVEEIKKVFSYFTAVFGNETDVSQIILSGGGALLKGFPRFFAKTMSIPVELNNPLKEIVLDKRALMSADFAAIAPVISVGIGLALRKIGDH